VLPIRIKRESGFGCALLLLLALELLCGLCLSARGQSIHHRVSLAEPDIEQTIAAYRSDDPKAAVASFIETMPAPVRDQGFRDFIHRSLPPEVTNRRVADTQIIADVRSLIEPVLTLYGRTEVYDLIVIDQQVPFIMADSGVVLVISTGAVASAESDDELLGYVAHEIGHEYFVKYSVAANDLRRVLMDGRHEPALTRKMAEALALIEIQCDAFAALTLAAMRRNPLAFISGYERMDRVYPLLIAEQHPPDKARRQVVSSILPKRELRVPPQESEALRVLKGTINRSSGKRA
jgi:hypothetical protein